MIVDKNISELLEVTSSSSPTPGGGSISALAGSLGASLSMMVTNLSIGKKFYEEFDEDIKNKFNTHLIKLEKLRDELEKIIDEDSSAFDGVMKAFKMPKETEEEKSIRSEKIQEGYIEAIEVPRKCANLCIEVLRLQEFLAEFGNINAITDVGVGALLAYSGLEGAILNVRINLNSIKNQELKSEIEEDVNRLLKEGKSLKETIMNVVYRRL